MLDEKTAALIDTCARYAGMFSGAPDEETAALRRYGRAVGMAFQISDDIIDISSTDSGKTPGTDLREGVRTLPVLYTLADPAADPRLRELVAGPITAEASCAEAVELLTALAGHGHGARETLAGYADAATAELDAAAGLLVPGRAGLAGPVRHRPHPLTRPRAAPAARATPLDPTAAPCRPSHRATPHPLVQRALIMTIFTLCATVRRRVAEISS